MTGFFTGIAFSNIHRFSFETSEMSNEQALSPPTSAVVSYEDCVTAAEKIKEGIRESPLHVR